MSVEEELTLWCGNLPSEVDEELLFELFLQIAPLQKVRIPMDNKSGKPVNYAFITFKHSCSVPYAIEILNGTKVYDKHIIVKTRNSNQQRSPHINFDQLEKMGTQMMMGGEMHGRNINFKNNAWKNQNNFRDRDDKTRPYRQDRNKYRHNRSGNNRYDNNEQYNSYGNNNSHGRRRY